MRRSSHHTSSRPHRTRNDGNVQITVPRDIPFSAGPRHRGFDGIEQPRHHQSEHHQRHRGFRCCRQTLGHKKQPLHGQQPDARGQEKTGPLSDGIFADEACEKRHQERPGQKNSFLFRPPPTPGYAEGPKQEERNAQPRAGIVRYANEGAPRPGKQVSRRTILWETAPNGGPLFFQAGIIKVPSLDEPDQERSQQ